MKDRVRHSYCRATHSNYNRSFHTKDQQPVTRSGDKSRRHCTYFSILPWRHSFLYIISNLNDMTKGRIITYALVGAGVGLLFTSKSVRKAIGLGKKESESLAEEAGDVVKAAKKG